MRAPRYFLDTCASELRVRPRDRRNTERSRSIQESRTRLIGRGIVIGLCALACVFALALHTQRVAAAGYIVNVTTDTGAGSGTTGDLRYAINQVNAGAGTGDTITITATGAITMRSGALPALAKPVAITGPGAAMLTVQAAMMPNTATYGVFKVNIGVTANIGNLTIANGNASSGGGIKNDGTLTVTNSTLSDNVGGIGGGDGGGGIENTGALTVTNSTFSGNSASGDYAVGGGIGSAGTLTVTNSTFSGNSASFDGGGIYNNSGPLTVTNSTFSGNSAPFGGGIYNVYGPVKVTNSTFSGNSATTSGANGGFGGGIENGFYGTLTVTNSTLSGNSASFDGGGIDNYNDINSTLKLTNTIIAVNTATGTGPDIHGAVASHGHNLIGNTTGGSGFVASDLQYVNPLLAPLADNGGTTPLPDGSHVKTQAITSTSPAFHAGDPTTCVASFPTGANSQDERGATFSRSTTACSIGAFEPQMITLAPTALPNGMLGTPYNQTITATGGTAPYTFAVTSGTLPPGLTLATNGTLSGKPTSAGSFSFTVTATDHGGATGSQTYSLVVPAPKSLPSPRPGGGTGGGPPNARPSARPTVPVVGVPNPVPQRRP